MPPRKKPMKKLIVILLASTGLAFGQSNSVYNASTFAYITQVTQGNPSTGSSSLVALPTGFAQGIPFLPYNVNASITINRNAANAETVTPTSVTSCYPNSLTCTLASTFGFKHIAGESIQSGTFGLQEALNIAVAAGSGTVLIDASWQGPSGNSLILAAKGNANVMIQDNRNPSGAVFYQWNGSAYVQTGGGTQTYILDTYLSPADGHGGTDFGYAMTNLCATLGCSTLTAPINVKTVQTGICKVYTSLTIPAPIHFESSSCAFVPQSSMASTPVALTSCSTTIGSTAVTCASTAGLSVGMAVGGSGSTQTLGPAQYVASVTNSTTFQLIFPASRSFLGILTNASATVKGVDSLIDAVTGQSVTGTGIPASTTITVNPATHTFTLSNVAAIGTLSPTDIVLAPGTVLSGLSLTAVAQNPIILVPPSNTATSQAKPHGVSYGVLLEHVDIRDPAYSHSSFGRSLSGLVGLWVYGQDNLVVNDLTIEGVKGSAIVLGGYVPASTADGSNVVRESDFNGLYLYSNGDLSSGQASLALMSGLGDGDVTQDEINTLNLHDTHIVYSDAESLVLGSYLHPGTNGPRLVTFTGDTQFEAGSNSNFSFGASDVVRCLTCGLSNKLLGGRYSLPGFGKSTFRISNALDWTVTGSELDASSGGGEVYNVGLSASSTTVTYVSAGTGGGSSFPPGPYLNGIGAQLNDGVTCTPCNVWLAVSNAVNGPGTQITLASPYTGSQTSGTLTIGGGGFFFALDSALSAELNASFNSYIDPGSPAISLLSLGSPTNAYIVGTGGLVSTPPGITDHQNSWTLENLILPPISYTANSSSTNINYNPAYLNSSGIVQIGSIATFASVGTGTNPRVNWNAVCSICGGDYHVTFQQNTAADAAFVDIVAGTSSQTALFSVNADNNTESWEFGLNGSALWTLFDRINSTTAFTVTPVTEAVAFTGNVSAPNLTPSVLTSVQSVATTTFSSIGIALPSVAASTTATIHCAIIWEQATAASTVQFGISNSSAPTQLSVFTAMNSDSNNISQHSYINRTGTTPATITSAPTTAIINTPYLMQLDGVLQNSATGPDVVTLYVETGVTTSAINIEPGSYCALVN
jgi:hypothetical protein